MLVRILLACILIMVEASTAFAGGAHAPPPTVKPPPTIRMELFPEQQLQAGKTVKVMVLLTETGDGTPVTVRDLKRVHTQKFHLLVIDPSLTDYHHLHPLPTGNPGEYSVEFTPRHNSSYRFWADITPKATKQQEYVVADISVPLSRPAAHPLKIKTYRTLQDGLVFTLAFDTPPHAGKASLGTVTIQTAGGKPFTELEPIMATYGHIVAFGEDYRTILHVHPIGAEPGNESDRGGPTLLFHIAPQQSGFVKLFVQVRVKGRDIFAPFGVKVE